MQYVYSLFKQTKIVKKDFFTTFHLDIAIAVYTSFC